MALDQLINPLSMIFRVYPIKRTLHRCKSTSIWLEGEGLGEELEGMSDGAVAKSIPEGASIESIGEEDSCKAQSPTC